MGSHENTGNNRQEAPAKRLEAKKKIIPLDTLLSPSKLDLAFLPGKNK